MDDVPLGIGEVAVISGSHALIFGRSDGFYTVSKIGAAQVASDEESGPRAGAASQPGGPAFAS